MSTWKIEQIGKKPLLKKPIFIEGLPGIGNVGKVAIDFLIDELKAKKIYEINSYSFPHCVFVNEDNLVELPTIRLFYKKFNDGKQDLLLLAGNVQPTDEISSYEFSEKILDLVQQFKGKEIITLGGIGLSDMPKKPRVYCTANCKGIIKRYKNKIVKDKLYGIVGPIVGVSGLLLGLAQKRKIEAIALLAETYGHPLYLGIKSAKEVLKVLSKELKLDINLNKLDKEIEDIEKDIIKRTEDLTYVSRQAALKKLKGKLGGKLGDVSYIG